MGRMYFLITIPESFVDKFLGMLKNINIANDSDTPIVVIENIFKKEDAALMPKAMDGGRE